MVADVVPQMTTDVALAVTTDVVFLMVAADVFSYGHDQGHAFPGLFARPSWTSRASPRVGRVATARS